MGKIKEYKCNGCGSPGRFFDPLKMADGRGKTGCVRTTKGINYFLHIIVG